MRTRLSGWTDAGAITLVVLGAVAGAAPSMAQTSVPAEALPSDGVPYSGFFTGIGVNGNVVVPTSQTIFAQGISNVTQGGVQAASGAAGGPTSPKPPVAATISPSAQLGYFQRFSESSWLWGGKFSYNYLAATATDNFVHVPQFGSFALTGGGPVTAFTGPQFGSFALTGGGPVTAFTGNVVIQAYQVTADHQLALVPFFGHTFDRSFVYFGAGPSLTHTETKLSGTVGFADINGVHTNITGAPATYTNTQWLIGATLAVGATYFLTPSWFFDIGYSFTITDLWNNSFSSPFSNTSAGYTTTGVISGSYAGGLNTHALMVAINRRF
jgi:hypothetical protein